MERRELGATVEPKGQRAEAESGPWRLEAESRETLTTATLEDGSPAELAPHRWWAEGEQRGCQTTVVEEAGSHTLTDVISSSGSAAILSSVAPCGDGSSVAAGSGAPSAVGSGMRSAQRGDGGLGTGSGVELARFSWEQVGNGYPFLASVPSTKAAKLARGPSSDNGALHAMFKLAS